MMVTPPYAGCGFWALPVELLLKKNICWFDIVQTIIYLLTRDSSNVLVVHSPYHPCGVFSFKWIFISHFILVKTQSWNFFFKLIMIHVQHHHVQNHVLGFFQGSCALISIVPLHLCRWRQGRKKWWWSGVRNWLTAFYYWFNHQLTIEIVVHT